QLRALSTDRHGRPRGAHGRRPLPGPDRGRRLKPHRPRAGGGRRQRLHPPMRPGARLHHHRRLDLAKHFDQLHDVRLRVGALPRYPSNALNYNLTGSTDGVINEYCEPCEAIVDGRRREVPAMEEREEFSLEGVTYEAFNTSGGLGTLCQTLEGKVR